MRACFQPVGRFMRGVAETFEFARRANAIIDTPDNVFEALGTSCDTALRALLNDTAR